MGVWGRFLYMEARPLSHLLGAAFVFKICLLEIIAFFSSDNGMRREHLCFSLKILTSLLDDPNVWTPISRFLVQPKCGGNPERSSLYFPSQRWQPGGRTVPFLLLCFLLPYVPQLLLPQYCRCDICTASIL